MVVGLAVAVFVVAAFGMVGAMLTIARILRETNLLPAAHLTCVGASRGEIDDVVARYHEVGVRHIVALRGDPTTGIGTAYQPHPDGYQSSPDLIAGIKKRYPDFEISVSAYPEKHPESRDLDTDIDTLQAKVDALYGMHREPSKNIIEFRSGDVASCYADPAFAAELLGWRAERKMDAMCVDAWRWQSNNPHGYLGEPT